MILKKFSDIEVSNALQYHITKNLTISESIFRVGSESYFKLIEEIRSLYEENQIELCESDQFIVENLKTGTPAKYKGKDVKLDLPRRSRPGEGKKFIVFRDSGKKDKDGNIKAKKITWGDPGATIKNHDDAARKSFLARHKCSEKTDKDTAGWWACNVHKFYKQLGLSSNKPW